MLDDLWTAALTWFAARAQKRVRRAGHPRADRGWHSAPAPEDQPPSPERLVGPEHGVRRLARVRRGTLALVRRGTEPPQVWPAGTLLVPPLRPRRDPLHARVVSTGPVVLELDLAGLHGPDGPVLPTLTLRLELQLDERRGPSLLLERAADHPEALEQHLLDQVAREVRTALEAALTLSGPAGLDGRGGLTGGGPDGPGSGAAALAALLEDRWLPSLFLGGLLVRRAVTVVEHRPDDVGPAKTPARTPARTPGRAPAKAPARTGGAR